MGLTVLWGDVCGECGIRPPVASVVYRTVMSEAYPLCGECLRGVPDGRWAIQNIMLLGSEV